MPEWHALSAEEALERRESSTDGLAEAEAARRLEEHGPNELTEAGAKSPWRILAEQFTSLLIIILVIAAVVSAALGDLEDAIAILAIIVLNGALGFRQEYKAEKTMSALRKLAAPVVRVRRGGDVREVPAAELVPGDIVLIEAGNVIPADARLLQSASLRVQEAALTGESEPVEKSVARLIAPDIGLADRLNMLFMGTAASYGRGEAVVTATGMDTELGKIAGMVQQVKSNPTPLQRRLAQLGRWLAVAALVLVIVIFVVGLLRGRTGAPDVPDRGQHGGGGGPRRPAGYRHRGALARRAADAAPQGPHPKAPGRGDARIGHRDLLRQDRHPHPEPDDGGDPRRGRTRGRPAGGDGARQRSSLGLRRDRRPGAAADRQSRPWGFWWRQERCATTRSSRSRIPMDPATQPARAATKPWATPPRAP